MKIYNAVKTETKAIELLNSWLNANLTEELYSTDTVIEPTSVRCACGETKAMQAFYEGGNKFATIAICDACGDNDAFEDEVTNVR